MPAKLVCGCGYLGERVVRRWIAAGDEVWATTRSNDRAKQFTGNGIRPIVVDIAGSISFPDELPEFHTVLFAVGFDRTAGQSIRHVYVDGLRNVLDAIPASVQRFIYISSTGVYGHTTGEWLDETSECQPIRPGGEACLGAEQLLSEHALAPRRIVLRLAGIYGPNRIPKLAAIRAGLPIESSEAALLNLIHVEDAVEVVLAAEQRAPLPALYVVADGHPVLRSDFYRELARLLSAPPPRFLEPSSNLPSSERTAGNKRVCSDLVRQELQLQFKFPSYREGLAAIVAQQTP